MHYIDLNKEEDGSYTMYDIGCGCCSEGNIPVQKTDIEDYRKYLEEQLKIANEALK